MALDRIMKVCTVMGKLIVVTFDKIMKVSKFKVKVTLSSIMEVSKARSKSKVKSALMMTLVRNMKVKEVQGTGIIHFDSSFVSSSSLFFLP